MLFNSMRKKRNVVPIRTIDVAGEAAVKEVKALDILLISKKAIQTVENEILAPLRRTKGYSSSWVTQVLQSTMIPNFVQK